MAPIKGRRVVNKRIFGLAGFALVSVIFLIYFAWLPSSSSHPSTGGSSPIVKVKKEGVNGPEIIVSNGRDDAKNNAAMSPVSGVIGNRRPLANDVPVVAKDVVADDPSAQFFAGASYELQMVDEACPLGRSKLYTEEEVGRHSTEDDLWINIHGYVLNVTDFLPSHPGGKMLLKGAGGKDAAELFVAYHNTGAVGLFKPFCIGRIRSRS
jgi:hypothetical protein